MISAKYEVEGMSCEHCVRAVTGELEQLDGVTAVRVDLATGAVEVDSSEELRDEAVRGAVAEAGYRLVDSNEAG